MNNVHTFTIELTKKSAKAFFTKLHAAGFARIVDAKLYHSSQLSGFAKRDDLEFFLKDLCDIEYVHLPELSATKEILDRHTKHKGDWNVYEREFLELMDKRRIQDSMPKELLAGGCLLCTEHLPKHCHRQIVVEYLARHWGNIETTHIT